MQKQFSYLTVGFSLLWILLIFMDYWYYHQPIYLNNLLNFQYTTLTLILGVLGGGCYLLISKLGRSNKPFFLANGIGIFLLFIALCALILFMHVHQLVIGIKISSTDCIQFLGSIAGVLTVTYLITACCFALGNFVLEKLFSLSFSKFDNVLISISLGMLTMSMLLFILGTFKLLLPLVIGSILLVLSGLLYKRIWIFLQYTLIKPIDLSNLNLLGFTSFYLILIFISLIYLQNIRPFPYGFDALATYMNLPNLIGKEHGIVSGFSPYYWSLFVALGHILFDSLPVVISLSVLGGILSGFSIYSLCKNWITPNQSFFITALFFSLPLVNFHAYRDIKTDLGLLFFIITTLLLLVNYLKYIYPELFKEKISSIANTISNQITKKRKKNFTVQQKQEVPKGRPGWLDTKVSKEIQYMILLGLVSGMALGSKLTALILIFSIIGILAYLKNGEIGFLTGMVFFIFIILIGKLDAASGLRNFHFGANQVMWGTLCLGIVGLVYLGWKDQANLLQAIKLVAVYSSITLLIYLPWPIKNYSETGNLSINTFIQGEIIGEEIKEFTQKMNE